MLIPLGTDRPLRRPTLVTYGLIAISLGVFAVQMAQNLQSPIQGEGQRAAIVEMGMLGQGFAGWYRYITYAFLHADFRHLLGNMLCLYVFGPNIEDRFGRIGFLAFYLLGAVCAGGLHVLMEMSPVIGASGAIAACTGAYLVMFPRTLVKVFSLLFYIGIFNIPAWWFIGLAIAWDVVSQGFSSTIGVRSNVAHLAHLGGYGFGIAVAFAVLWLKLVPREQYDLFSQGRQVMRRRQFKEAAYEHEKLQAKKAQQASKANADTKEAEELSAARLEVVNLLNQSNPDGAAKAYKSLADRFAHIKGGTTLSRKHQYQIASHLYSSGDSTAAAFAFERFLETYPKDPESGQIRLLLGLIYARSLNDPITAKRLINEALKDLDEQGAELARKELAALG